MADSNNFRAEHEPSENGQQAVCAVQDEERLQDVAPANSENEGTQFKT